MLTVSKPYPKEFRDEAVRVANRRARGVGLDQIAEDFGVHFTTSAGLAERLGFPSRR
jgi:hypothetical protein